MADLTYRPPQASDFEAMHAIVSDWSVVRQLGSFPWPAAPDFTRQRCRAYGGQGFVWAICRDDQMIGTVAVTRGELGYKLAPGEQGKGIMTRACSDAINHGFAQWDWPCLTASVWWDNAASAKVLRRCGFIHWQTRYHHSIARRSPTLLHDYRLTRADWEDLRSAAQ
ncbi:MAG: GNAT family N-acetyltransferase [Loktanella sp.]|nr:GNAT family N-acetyltransferase [Loktanella sp.]